MRYILARRSSVLVYFLIDDVSCNSPRRTVGYPWLPKTLFGSIFVRLGAWYEPYDTRYFCVFSPLRSLINIIAYIIISFTLRYRPMIPRVSAALFIVSDMRPIFCTSEVHPTPRQAKASILISHAPSLPRDF